MGMLSMQKIEALWGGGGDTYFEGNKVLLVLQAFCYRKKVF